MADPLVTHSRFSWSAAGWAGNYFQGWIERRLRPARCQSLNRKTLFIFPTAAGFGFLFVNLLLWLTATNYENNLILAAAFLQTSMFVVCIFHTFFNLAGLSIEALHASSCVLGENAELQLQLLRRTGAGKENIQLGCDRDSLVSVNLISETSCEVKLYVPGLQRGWYQPQRILVQSCFPLGLIRCWTWLAFDLPVLVYPKPLPGGDIPLGRVTRLEGDISEEQGAEDFVGFREYVAGMPTRHIAWKQYARGQALYSKEYVTCVGHTLWLDWHALEGLSTEARLSRLCFWVLQLGTQAQPLGLRLPQLEIEPATGEEQRRKLLRALALYQSSAQANLKGANVKGANVIDTGGRR